MKPHDGQGTDGRGKRRKRLKKHVDRDYVQRQRMTTPEQHGLMLPGPMEGAADSERSFGLPCLLVGLTATITFFALRWAWAAADRVQNTQLRTACKVRDTSLARCLHAGTMRLAFPQACLLHVRDILGWRLDAFAAFASNSSLDDPPGVFSTSRVGALLHYCRLLARSLVRYLLCLFLRPSSAVPPAFIVPKPRL
ncbi:hypothetical protein SVAN01_01224 [Stagonosporopsis vannaccii]|nr:hypothetical protein SVAN01_01224 [Stagonosporopsis vannaccii]